MTSPSAALNIVSSALAASQVEQYAMPADHGGLLPIIGAANDNTIGGRILSANQSLVTYYISDPQFEFLSARGFTHNPLLKWFIEPADRNVILTQTAPLWVDELIRHEKRRRAAEEAAQYRKSYLAIEIKGDVADTPLRKEIERLKHILKDHDIPIECYTCGNHERGNVFGVFNLSSPWYHRIRNLHWWPFSLFRLSLDEQLEGAAGLNEDEETANPDEKPEDAAKRKGQILNQQATFEAMHEIVSLYREDKPGPKRLTTAVHAADYDGYQLLQGQGEAERIPFSPENLERNFKTFWKPTKGTQMGITRETRFWECIVNYDIADDKQDLRATKVNPIYLQASETARFHADDGTEYPVYTISVDGLDHNNLVAAVGAGVSEFQVRLIENFMETALRENSRARFKISSHFSAKELTSVPWYMPWRARHQKRAREAFRRLLARDEVILFSFGHTHRRSFTDLNKTLKLKRKTPLMEVNAPSLIDYHPNRYRHNGEYHDARALVAEKLRFVDDKKGRRLVIDLEYRGLDSKDVVEGRTPEVDAELAAFTANHGYNRARETAKQLRNKHVIGWLKSHSKRLLEFLGYGILQAPVRPKKWWNYWKNISVAQYVIDNFTVVSTVNMFNEAHHIIPFIESVAKFIGMDEEPGQLAVRGRLLSLRTALIENAYAQQHKFERALASGERPRNLKEYNDLFLRARTHRLADLLLDLRPGSPARAFAVLASIRASREEFQKRRFFLFKTKPTDVPNELPPIEIPLPDTPPIFKALGF
jgi:hypothetical protein